MSPGAAFVVLVLALGAWDQSKVWHDSETLWSWATAIDPGCSVCWNNLGKSLTDQNRHPEAEAAYRRALELRPYRARFASNLATALYARGKHAQAEEMLRVALRLDPLNIEGRAPGLPRPVDDPRKPAIMAPLANLADPF